MKKKVNNKVRERIKLTITFVCSFIIIFTVLATVVAPKKYDYKVGDIALNDIKATRDTIDKEATDKKIQEAKDAVEDIYVVKADVQNTAEDNIRDLFQSIMNIIDENNSENTKIAELQQKRSTLNNTQCEYLLSLDDNDLKEIQDNILKILDEVYNSHVQDNNEESRKQAEDLVDSDVDELNYNSTLNPIVKQITKEEIQPNLFYDSESTEKAKEEAEKSVQNVIIKKNQIIVNEGEPITEGQIAILKSLGLSSNDSSGSIIIYVSLAVFVIAILFLQNLYIYRNYYYIFKQHKKIVLINLLSVMTVLLARGLTLVSPYIIPMACAPLLMTVLINYKVSIYVNMLNVFYIAAITDFDPSIILIAVLCTILSSTFMRRLQQRNDILYASLFIAIIISVVNFCIGVFLSSDIKVVLINTLLMVVGTITSAILTIGLLPILEGAFDVVTTLKLLELSNPNNPLLKKLLMEAPGTYHHSMLVANLAEMAADEVGANSVIARIGAYYHDIGKITRPYFFKENQLTNENPHDNINENLSAMIIISHVKDGVEMAKEYNLPEMIIDIIKQHHGTTLVKYFYYTARNKSEYPDDIKEEDFRYKGPIPNTKESAIIMLADSTEAAVRSINDPTTKKLEEMVNNIVDDKVKAGQLDNCELTLKDLSKIKECFLRALNGIYHKRIEYPKEEK